MTTFFNFFKGKSSTEHNNHQAASRSGRTQVNRDLFLNPESPISVATGLDPTNTPASPEKRVVDMQESLKERDLARRRLEKQQALAGDIRGFLDQDSASAGYQDGYQSHSAEVAEQAVRLLKATFRNLLSKKIEELRERNVVLQREISQYAGLGQELIKPLEIQRVRHDDVIAELEKEQRLSVEEEGMIMEVIHRYRDGFIRGTQAWQNEKLFLQTSNMFNL